MELKHPYYCPSADLIDLLNERGVKSQLAEKGKVNRDTLWRITNGSKKVVSRRMATKIINRIKEVLDKLEGYSVKKEELVERYFTVYNFITQKNIGKKEKSFLK